MTEIILSLVRFFFGRPPFEQRSKLQAIAVRRDGRTVPHNHDWHPWQRLMLRLGWQSESVAFIRQSSLLRPLRWLWRSLSALPSKMKAYLVDEMDKTPRPAAENSNV